MFKLFLSTCLIHSIIKKLEPSFSNTKRPWNNFEFLKSFISDNSQSIYFMNCTIFLTLNCIFFPANEEATLITKQPIIFQGLFKVTNQIAEK